MNKETLKNSYQRFEEEGIINVVKSKDTKIPPRLRLAPEWQPPRDPTTGKLNALGSRLWNFTEKIASSRREGKNRRDGATVSTRVVHLTDVLGQRLFVQALSGMGQGKSKGSKGAESYPMLSSEDEATLRKNVKEGRRKRTLEKRARL